MLLDRLQTLPLLAGRNNTKITFYKNSWANQNPLDRERMIISQANYVKKYNSPILRVLLVQSEVRFIIIQGESEYF